MYKTPYKKNRIFTRDRIQRFLLAALLIAGLTAGAQNLNSPSKPGPLGTYVNVLSGNLFVPRTDMVIPGRGFDLMIKFYYNSFLLYEDFGYGKGWTFQYNIRYSDDTVPGRKTILWGDGREDQYDSLPGGVYKSPRGFFTRLVQYSPGRFRLTEKDSTSFYFDDPSHKKITRLQEPNGNYIQFNYAGGKLSALQNKAGQSISFTYDGNGRLASVVDAVAQPVRTFLYKYDAGGRLTEVKDPLNGTWKYSYLVNGPMKTLTDKNNNTIDIIYFPDFSTREMIGCNKRLSFSYDTTLKKTVVTDYLEGGANQVTTYTYQKLDNISWITSMSGNCCGFNMRFEYDAQGNKTRETDANGNVYTYSYDAYGNMLTATDPLGGKSTYTYSENFNKVTSYKDPNGNLYVLEYDAAGNMVGLQMPGNRRYTATYNSQGDIISSTDPNGAVFTYHYDAFGNPTTVTGPDGYKATLLFDARGNLLSYVDARGQSRSAVYDILNRLKTLTDPINHSLQYSYDAAGNIVSLKNKNNETSTVRYDASNRPVKITGATGNTTEIAYDEMDNILSIKNALGNALEFGYDNRNRVNRVKDAEGNIAAFTYDGNGNLTSAQHPDGQIVNYVYDQQNRLIKATDATGDIAVLTYDANGNITSYKNGTGALASFRYDSLNRLVRTLDPLGNATSYTYDKNNNVVSVTDGNGFTRQYTYDGMNRVKTITDANGFVTTLTHDAAGNVSSLTDQNGNKTTYTYDEMNRRKTMTFPDGRRQDFSYDAKGNLVTKKLTDGSVIAFTYDTLNRMVAKTLPDGEVHRFAYDKIGRLLTATNNRGTVFFTYDALNRVTSETFNGRTVNYTYNTSGRTQTTIYPDSSVVTKEFDTRNRLSRVWKDSVLMAEYDYNNANQMTAKRLGNGVQTFLQYDGANRLSRLITAGGSIQQLSYTYDKAGNKTAINRSGNPSLSETFTYDKGYRLVNYIKGTEQSSYTYDAVGNRTAANLSGINTTYTVNNLNQLTAKNGTPLVYDQRGNLTFDGLFWKTYDAEGRLLKDSSSPTSVLTYAYDALGRRVTKTINGQPFSYTYSGASQIEERDAANNLLTETVFTGFLAPLVNEKNGNRFFYHQNHLLSVEAITTASGRLLESYRYDAFGKLQRFDSTGQPLFSSPSGNRFGFTGQEWDSATGSYRFYFRNYSPETGVFNQRDLIEYGDGTGMYQYVGNNPANGVDVWGLATGPDGKPCYDKDEYLFMTEKLWTEEVNIMRNRVNKLGFLGIFDYAQFDSRFYKDQDGDYARRNAYYFRGNTYESWELNYYFQGMIGKANTQGVAGSQFNAKAWAASKGRTPSQKTLDMVEMGNNETPAPRNNGWFSRNEIPPMAEQADMMPPDYDGPPVDLEVVKTKEGIEWPTYNTRTKEFGKVLLESKANSIEEIGIWNDLQWKFWEVDGFRQKAVPKLPPCPPPGGTRNPPPNFFWDGLKALIAWVLPLDPNDITGPTGVQSKKWVAVKDRMHYTIRCENDTAASSPARFIRITAPVHPKQDPATLELGSFGFNSQTFDVPPGLSSFYQRYDCRDSMGLYLDVVAGYDPQLHLIFWEFRGIDPVTLLPTDDPEKGILFLQDTAHPLYGHGYFNFSLKPESDAVTGDTAAAEAAIVFDENEAIATNVWTNTLDAVAPTSRITEASFNRSLVTLKWTGRDDEGGSGLEYYSLYVSADGVNYSLLTANTTRTDTSFQLAGAGTYCFFVLATDSVGNAELLDNRTIVCAAGGGVVLPVTWLTFSGKTVGKDNQLDWSTAAEQNSKAFLVQRSFDGQIFTTIGTVAAAGNSSTTRTYQYTDKNIDQLNRTIFYYRLQQVDGDGKTTLSNTVRLNYAGANRLPSVVYPNPTTGTVTITVGDRALIGTTASVYDQNGRLLQMVKITGLNQSISLGTYTNGTYYIRLQNKELLKVIKQ